MSMFFEKTTITIANGASMSAGINLDTVIPTQSNMRLFGLVIPNTWTAANITFQASFDGGTTWNNVLDSSGSEHYLAPVANGFQTIDASVFASIPMLKIRSGTSAVPVNQEQDSTITLVLRSF